ncbi:MAG TPA: 6-phosphogluconolactonase [Candidatus Aquilonibacter sp.]|nr:6-phosphogluconolactonase [Candidatus Aquilonibacter sp.]
MSPNFELRKLTTPQDLFQAAADEVIHAAEESVSKHNCFTIALSGGSTPKNLYNLIAANASSTLPWDRMFFFFGDERHVPPDNAESNFRMANESLLSKVPIPPGNIFRVPSENPDASAAAEAYEKSLRSFFAVQADEFPHFDLILLGMGPDGHTASLFPETAALQEKSRLVVANWVEKLKTHRITFTLPVINAARRVLFLVSGTDKAAALHEVLEGKQPAEKYPSKLVRPTNGKLIWLVDRAAASELSAAA